MSPPAAAVQMSLFEEAPPEEAVPQKAEPSKRSAPRQPARQPHAYPALANQLALNDELVARKKAESQEKLRRKKLGLPKLVKTEADKAEERILQERWMDACRVLALRGHEPLPFPDMLEEVRRRVTDDPGHYGLQNDPAALDPDSIVFLNCGLGQNSVCLCVLLVLGLLPAWIYSHHVVIVFSDTMAERPSTYAYALNVLIPFLDRYGVEFVWLMPDVPFHYGMSEPAPELAWLDEALAEVKTESRFHVTRNRVLKGIIETYVGDVHASFPMWSSRARCTTNHKQNVLARYRDAVRRDWNGRSAVQQTNSGYRDWVLVGIGADEPGRAEPTLEQNYLCLYPLLAYNLGRQEQVALIEAAALPVPEKSGCCVCYAAPMYERWYLSQVFPAVFGQMVAMEQASIEDRLNRIDPKTKLPAPLKPNYVCQEYDLPLPEAVAKWHEENPHVTVEMCAEWLISRTYNRDERPVKCHVTADQLTFDVDGLDPDEVLALLEEIEAEEAGDQMEFPVPAPMGNVR